MDSLQNYQFIKNFLEEQYNLHHKNFFIETDPIYVPHQYSKLQDIEIAGFFCGNFSLGTKKNYHQKLPKADANDG
jgi:hypothetical protein